MPTYAVGSLDYRVRARYEIWTVIGYIDSRGQPLSGPVPSRIPV